MLPLHSLCHSSRYLVLFCAFDVLLFRLKGALARDLWPPVFSMYQPHTDPWFFPWNIFEFGFDFAEIFEFGSCSPGSNARRTNNKIFSERNLYAWIICALGSVVFTCKRFWKSISLKGLANYQNFFVWFRGVINTPAGYYTSLNKFPRCLITRRTNCHTPSNKFMRGIIPRQIFANFTVPILVLWGLIPF
jgi:hypothetical protein